MFYQELYQEFLIPSENNDFHIKHGPGREPSVSRFDLNALSMCYLSGLNDIVQGFDSNIEKASSTTFIRIQIKTRITKISL